LSPIEAGIHPVSNGGFFNKPFFYNFKGFFPKATLKTPVTRLNITLGIKAIKSNLDKRAERAFFSSSAGTKTSYGLIFCKIKVNIVNFLTKYDTTFIQYKIYTTFQFCQAKHPRLSLFCDEFLEPRRSGALRTGEMNRDQEQGACDLLLLPSKFFLSRIEKWELWSAEDV
jgi:hypothetical protein